MKTKRKYKTSTINNAKFIDSERLYQKFIDPKSVLMKIHDAVDFSFVNDLCNGIYSDDGQHAYSPELVFKVGFIQYFKNGISDNEVVKQCKTNMEYRAFCDLSVDDDLFDDCKLSRFRAELGPERFNEISNMIITRIKDAGFINEKDVQYMDSFLFLADVKLVSINSLVSKSVQNLLKAVGTEDQSVNADAKKRDFELSEDQQKERFVFLIKTAQRLLASADIKNSKNQEVKEAYRILQRVVHERSVVAGNGEVRKKDSKEERDKIMSISDPDARMMGKNEKDIHPSYKSHVAMNNKGFITYTDVTLATVYDGHHAPHTIHDLKERGFKVPATVGDTHYGDIKLREDMAEEQTQVIAPYRKNQTLNSCLTNDTMIEAWAYNHTKEYKEHKRIRSHIEPKQGEMKNIHGMKRARFRGLPKVRIQNFMSAIATNCKRFVASAFPG